MNKKTFIEEIIKANFHKGGIKCLALFRIKEEFFNKLKHDVLNICQNETPSDVTKPNHISHSVTKPYGENYQYSLFNKSGKCNDYTTDWSKSQQGKKFHLNKLYPALFEFTSFFEGRTNMKLLVLGPKSGLYPHESSIIVSQNRSPLLLRFHLPIFTNNKCEMLLDDEVFQFKSPYIYFFNEGCVHSAYNHSNEYRYHLSWDMYLNNKTFDLMFSEVSWENGMFSKVIDKQRELNHLRYEKTNDYELQGSNRYWYDRLKMRNLNISQPQFNTFYNELIYMLYKLKTSLNKI